MVELLMEDSGGLEESRAVTNDPIQMSSTHVMMVWNNTVYKVVYSANEAETLYVVHRLCANHEHDCLIKLQLNIEKQMKLGISLFQYPKVKYMYACLM